MGKDFVVSVSDPERAKFFQEVFGRTEVCVKSPVPTLAGLPGFDEPQPVFFLDLELITPEERERLIQHISQRWNIPSQEVAAQLDEHGVPILDQHCYVAVHNPQRWL